MLAFPRDCADSCLGLYHNDLLSAGVYLLGSDQPGPKSKSSQTSGGKPTDLITGPEHICLLLVLLIILHALQLGVLYV